VPPPVATAPVKQGPRWPRTQDPASPGRDEQPPPEFVHSLLAARRGNWLPFLAGGGGPAVGAGMLAAQSAVGNQAVAKARQGAELPAQQEEPAEQPAEQAAEDAAAPPAPSAKDVGAAAPEPAAAPDGGVPGAAPAAGKGKGASPAAGGGGAPVTATTAQALQQQASAVAKGLPQPPAPAKGAAAPPKRRAAPRKAARQPEGPPPIPMVKPSYAEVADPIPEATKRIETAANQKLPERALPAAEPSPGGHMPDFSARPLTATQRQLLKVGEEALKDAQLPADQAERVAKMRERLLAPPEPAPVAGPPLPPAQIKVAFKTLPPAEITVAEQELFTNVLARLSADTGKQAREVLDAIKAGMSDYPEKALFNTDFPALRTLGEASLLPGIEQKLKTNVAGVAESIGAAGKILDDAVAVRREEIKTHPERSAVALQAEADALVGVSVADTAARLAEAEQAKAVAEDAKDKAKILAQKPKPGFKDMAEAAVSRIRDKVADAIARFKFQEKERLLDLDQARAKQLAAYEDAAAADQVVAAKANAPPTGGKLNPVALLQASKRNSDVINAAAAWVTKMTTALDIAVDGFKADVRAQTADWIKAVEEEGATAFRDLRAWGDAQEGGTESWWQDNARKLDAWAAATHDSASAWANIEGRLARLQLQRDLQVVRWSIDDKLANDQELGADYQALTEGRKKEFVDSVFAERREAILDGLAAGLVGPLLEAERAPGEKVVDAEILALPNDEWKAVNYLAKLGNSLFDAQASGTAIYNAGEGKWARTDEDTIFDKLSGLRPIELEAIRKYYENEHGPGTLYSHLDGELSGYEWRRAKQLLKGKEGEAAAEVIDNAVSWPADGKKIVEVLNGLDPDQRKAAEDYYFKEHGVTLESRLSVSLSDSKLAQAKALLANNRTEAYAHELDEALRSRMGGGNREGVTAVYDRVRAEAMVEAKKYKLSPAEYDALVEKRNAELEQAFEEKLGKVGKYRLFNKNQSALQGAFSYAFAGDPTQAKLVRALANNDLPKADAALMQHEREGIYADDDVLNGVVRQQKDRALARVQLERGPALRMGIDSQLKREEKAATARREDGTAPTPWTPRDRMDRKMALEREMNEKLEDLSFDQARRNSAVLDTVLQANHKISLDAMIEQNMSGGDRRQARDRVRIMRQEVADNPGAKKARRLDWVYNQIRYSIEGAGTNMDDLRAGLGGLTKAEIGILDERWRQDHDGETLREAVQGDTSGREEGDLVDTVDNGAATTVKARMEEAKRRLARDEAATGFLGRWSSGDETAAARRALAEMEKLNADLDNPNLSPERRAHIAQMTDQRIDTANQAIETRRTAVDAMADTLTTAFQYVVGALAIVAGAIAMAVTGGGALPILIAIIGSVVGTLGSMAIKQAVKGGDYGSEEFATDFAVGAVDAVVTAVTAGAFKGGTFLKGLGLQLKQFSAASIKISVGQALKRGAAMTLEQRIKEQARRQGTTALGRGVAWVGRGAKNFAVGQAHNILPTLPTTLTANLLNERNLRNGNPLRNIARGTVDQSIEGLKMGMGMAAFGHVVNVGIARAAIVTHPPMSSPMGRHLDFQRWQLDNPGKPHADYAAHVEAQQAREAKHSEQAAAATKEVRRALLDQLPPKDRGAVADVPIVHLSDADFTALSRGKGNGDAMIHVRDGQAAIVVRAGAESPAAAVKGLAAELREKVAPGTAGRTVDPQDSLPPRLRNRIIVEPTTRLGPHGVLASPLVDAAGRIVGVQLEVGPLARASDIKNHVGTIDGMRKFVGLLGEVRLKLLDIGQAVGLDLVSPRQQGRWEAAREIAKLPGVIEDFVRRLSEPGLDPRRRAKIEGQIENLRAQFKAEQARFAQGADAEARGYVAADPGGVGLGKKAGKGRDKGAKPESGDTNMEVLPRSSNRSVGKGTSPEPQGAPAPRAAEPEAAIAARAAEAPVKAPATPDAPGETPISPETLARIDRILELMRKINARGAEAYGKSKQDVITEPRNKLRALDATYLGAVENNATIWKELPPELQKKIKSLTRRAEAETLTNIHIELLKIPAVELMMTSGKPPDVVSVLRRADEHVQTIVEWRKRQAGYERTQAIAEGRVAKLSALFEKLGKVVMGVPLHPDLPRLAQGVDYAPREVPGLRNDGSEKSAAEKAAHINGYRSELRLGNEIIKHQSDYVVQFANAAGINGADAISVHKETGEVMLWDSKYRSTSKTRDNSPTFEDGGTREKAVKRAIAYVQAATNLPPHIKELALAKLNDDTYTTTTAYTDGGPFTNVSRRYTPTSVSIVAPPW
jgi:hypothetical protein